MVVKTAAAPNRNPFPNWVVKLGNWVAPSVTSHNPFRPYIWAKNGMWVVAGAVRNRGATDRQEI
jgi:hypothetical protein